MPEYDYEIVDPAGRVVKGIAEATSVADLVRDLSADGNSVVQVKEYRTSRPQLFRRSVRLQDLMIALHELALLLESGVSLGNAIQAQSTGTPHPSLAAAFEAMSRALMRGESLFEALRGARLALPPYVYRLVEAGELNGQLAVALRQAVEQLRYDERVASEIRGALLYPSILVTAGCAAVMLVFVIAVPQFAYLLEAESDLPRLADVVLRSGLWASTNGWMLATILGAIAIVVATLAGREGVRQRIRDVLSRLPILAGWFAETDTAKWASLMGAMQESRVGLLDALDLSASSVRITRRRAILEQVKGDIRSGSSLSAALERRRALTPTGYSLLRAGEQSGQLPQTLKALATLYEENSRRRMKRFLTLIEPLAVVLVGGFLGVIMIGIILAITSVNDIAI